MRTLLVLLALLVAAGAASAQPYPAKPVRLVVGFAPGGGTDLIARLLAQKLTERWGQPVVVENKLGASGNIAAELVAKSAPDGYTLLMAFSSHASNAALSNLPFDIKRDFSAITQVASGPAVVLANPALPAKTLGDLITYAKAHPGAIKYGSSGVGTPVHLAGDEVDFWYALLGPGGMRGALVERIQRDVAAIVTAPEMKESLVAQGCIPVGSKPAELNALIAREYALWAKVVKERGVKVE